MLTRHRPKTELWLTFLGGDESVLCNKTTLWTVRVVAAASWGALAVDLLAVDILNDPGGRIVQLIAAMAGLGLIVLAVVRPFHEIAEVFYDAGRRDEYRRWMGKQRHPTRGRATWAE